MTRYGTPVAKITAVDYEIKDVTQELRIPKEIESTFVNVPAWAEKISPKEPALTVTKEVRRCEAKGCKNEAISKATYENPETFVEESAYYCADHLKQLRRTVSEVEVDEIH